MSIIPLHLQRKFEQRWTARFVRPVASAAPKGVGLKDTVNSLSRKATRLPRATDEAIFQRRRNQPETKILLEWSRSKNCSRNLL